MAHAPETSAENRLHFSGASFWYVCHANLGPHSSGTRFRLTATFIFAPEILTPDLHGTKNWRRKPAPENGVDFRHRFLESV